MATAVHPPAYSAERRHYPYTDDGGRMRDEKDNYTFKATAALSAGEVVRGVLWFGH
jgi:hypothetical protein